MMTDAHSRYLSGAMPPGTQYLDVLDQTLRENHIQIGIIVNRAEQRAPYYAREHTTKEVDRRGSRIRLPASLGRLLISAGQWLTSMRKGRVKPSTNTVQNTPEKTE